MIDPPGEFLFHYTSPVAAIDDILPEGGFRLSPFSSMRDPRESGTLNLSAAYAGELVNDFELYRELNDRFQDLRMRSQLMSLTRDAIEDGVDDVFKRGFSRPRLWEQCGDCFRGVCLCFDRAALIDAAETQLRGLGQVVHRCVQYVDAPVALEARYADLDGAGQSGHEYEPDLVAEHADELFFTKSRDWRTEVEYRFVLITDDEEPHYVDVRNALRGVVMGAEVDLGHLRDLQGLCKRLDLRLFGLPWLNGQPRLIAIDVDGEWPPQ